MMKKLFIIALVLCMLLFIAGNTFADGPDAPVRANNCNFTGCGTMNCLVLTLVSCINGYLDYSDFVCV